MKKKMKKKFILLIDKDIYVAMVPVIYCFERKKIDNVINFSVFKLLFSSETKLKKKIQSYIEFCNIVSYSKINFSHHNTCKSTTTTTKNESVFANTNTAYNNQANFFVCV